MSKGSVFVVGLILGAAGGSFLTHTFLKQNYSQKADEEIASVREALLAESAQHRKEKTEKEMAEQKQKADQAMKKYGSAVPETNKIVVKLPYEIPPEIYEAEDNPYQRVGLKLYMNNVMVDEENHCLRTEEWQRMLGIDALTYFGHYEEDRICIRNDYLKTDFEVCMINQDYPQK